MADVAYGLTLNAARSSMPLEMPYLRVANVLRGSLDLSDVKTVGCEPGEVSRFVLQAGDILVVEGHASVVEIGRAALWQCEIERCLHQNHILRARCSGALMPEYLLIYLNSQSGRAYFRRNAKSSSGLNTINSTVLKEMPVPLPQKARQADGIRHFTRLNQRTEELRAHVSSCIQLKNALLTLLLNVK